MDKSSKLVIVGNSAFAQIAYEYFTHDSPYEVVAFAVDQMYITDRQMFDLPVVAIEEVEHLFPAATHDIFVASTYTQLNRLRARFADAFKSKGYALASYISSRCFIWHNVKVGKHVFIFEDNTIQPFVEIGNNVVLWSGNHIGHHSKVEDNVFIASHAVISGFCNIGANTFVGVNATVANNVNIAEDCLIGAGACVLKSTSSNQLFGASNTKPKEDRTAKAYFGVE